MIDITKIHAIPLKLLTTPYSRCHATSAQFNAVFMSVGTLYHEDNTKLPQQYHSLHQNLRFDKLFQTPKLHFSPLFHSNHFEDNQQKK